MINGKEFAEKMFSEVNDNIETQEKLYSTGSEELDAMLEKAFSEGYEYAQKEFASARQRKKNVKNAAKIEDAALNGKMSIEEANKALGKIQGRQGSGKVLEVANAQGPDKMKEVTVKAQKSERQARHIAEGLGNGDKKATQELAQTLNKKAGGTGKNLEKHVAEGGFNPKQAKVNRMTQESEIRKKQKVARAERQKKATEERKQLREVQKQEAKARQTKALEERSKKLELGKQKQQEQIKNAKEYQASKPKPNTTSTPKPTTTPTKPTPSTPKPKQKEVAEGFIKKNWNKLGKGGKIAAVAVPTVAAVGTGIAIKRNKKNK